MSLVFRLYGVPMLAGITGAAAGLYFATGLNLDGLQADLVTLMGAALFGAAAVIWSRRGLREFPLGLAVHVVNEPVPASPVQCAVSGTSRTTDRALRQIH